MKIKKYRLPIMIFISGLIVGVTFSLIALERFESDVSTVHNFMCASDLENLSFKVYNSGEYTSSVIVLNYLINKLRQHEDASDNEDVSRALKIDRGLAHARLYVLHKKRGEEKLAQKEYMNAVRLLEDEYKVTTENKMKNLVEIIDKGKKGDNP